MKKTFIFLLCGITSAHAEMIFEPGVPDPFGGCVLRALQTAEAAQAPHNKAWEAAMYRWDFEGANREAQAGTEIHRLTFSRGLDLCKDVYRNVAK